MISIPYDNSKWFLITDIFVLKNSNFRIYSKRTGVDSAIQLWGLYGIECGIMFI